MSDRRSVGNRSIETCLLVVAASARRRHVTIFETISVDNDGGVALVTLNRPEVLNALSDRLRQELETALDGLRRDDGVKVLVLTGGGERAFSAGLDLREFSRVLDTMSPTDMRRFRWSKPSPLATFDKPTIAAVNGLAVGGGVEMALLCDIVVAAEHATFAFAEVRRGLMPGNGGTQRLARRVGRGRALEMILTGRTITAQEAVSIGLADHLVAGGQLLAKAHEIAHAIAGNAPAAVRMARDAIQRGLEMPLEDGLRLESDLAAFLYTTADAREGPKAFVEKRPPSWTGQ